jgi:hypothetical protein
MRCGFVQIRPQHLYRQDLAALPETPETARARLRGPRAAKLCPRAQLGHVHAQSTL